MLEPGRGRVPLRGGRETNVGLGFIYCCPALGLAQGARPMGQGTTCGAVWPAHSRPQPGVTGDHVGPLPPKGSSGGPGAL